ncbi:MAG: aldehyde dehydrogenase family protein [Nannocystaceae bacterium]
MSETTKITYATLTADNEALHNQLDEAVARVRGELGQTHPLFIGAEQREGPVTFASTSPIDTRVSLGAFQSGTVADADDAIAAAKAAAPRWAARPWQQRAELLDRAAQLIRERLHDLTAWLMLEMGKNRVEALGEIEETADLILYYNEQMRKAGGYQAQMAKLDPKDTNTSMMRPYGVWSVISPWNFPYALAAAPAAAALLTGNTVVMKPASETPMAGVLMLKVFRDAGIPSDVVHMVSGGGSTVGKAMVEHPDVDGITFTGSYDVGFRQIYRDFAQRYPKPCITEMGGKNPAIVMTSADVKRAVSGVYRSAFGMSGQKCSACSRVYVHQDVKQAFVDGLVKMARATKIGDPTVDRNAFMGPLAHRTAFEDFQRHVSVARDSGKVVVGGDTLRSPALSHGYFVEPTIVLGLPEDHQLVRDELFVPLLCVQEVNSFEEALAKANDTPYGLTAGCFSQDQKEVDAFLNGIQAGVVYVNRSAGATTGAWPGVQPFGGWKGSGSTGKNIGGPYTLTCYLREQSRTLTA